MKLKKTILEEIKRRIKAVEPDARILLYGSYARGDAHEESDVDLLILVDKENLSFNDKTKISYPLYDFGIESGRIISTLIQTKKNWEEKYFYTPLFHNISREGIEL